MHIMQFITNPPPWLSPVVFGFAMALGGASILLSLRPGVKDRTLAVLGVLFLLAAGFFLYLAVEEHPDLLQVW